MNFETANVTGSVLFGSFPNNFSLLIYVPSSLSIQIKISWLHFWNGYRFILIIESLFYAFYRFLRLPGLRLLQSHLLHFFHFSSFFPPFFLFNYFTLFSLYFFKLTNFCKRFFPLCLQLFGQFQKWKRIELLIAEKWFHAHRFWRFHARTAPLNYIYSSNAPFF